LGEAGGVLARAELEDVLTALDREQRGPVNKLGIRIGTLDVFVRLGGRTSFLNTGFIPSPRTYRFSLRP